ncbi:MAG: 1-(5-phosphoribosyl)-5-[(5-phosphoribosylamino)methylideneamino]imidazole-4-carboxamide isomerase [Bacteroidota bacterium]|nr:1-(5-phosphoribosyl)-5-[(5-phosphoribosylamino)methylideneamino]imidazole-4-carboxamide isomerase [Bacteroidota bacterium]
MIRIVPAIDIIGGKCVRLQKGDYAQKKVYNENPLEVAKMYEDAGIKYLHLVDLDGAKEKHVVNLQVLKEITSKTNLLVDFGGGIKSDNDMQLVLDNGANQVTVGSVAVSDPALFEKWIAKFGSDKIILGADVSNGKIAISGWQNVTTIDLSDFLNTYQSKGVKYVLCTDISKDGMLQGTSLDLYHKLRINFPFLHIFASGGITYISEIERLDKIGIFGVIIGKSLYEGNIQLADLKRFYQ